MVSKVSTVFLILTCFRVGFVHGTSEADEIESKQQEHVEGSHRIDALNILMFMSLHILTVLTIWLFKHRRFRFVHETGLGIIYGLIIGAIIRYTSSGSQKNSAIVNLSPEYNFTVFEPPDSLKLEMYSNRSHERHYFQYVFKNKVNNGEVGARELEEKNSSRTILVENGPSRLQDQATFDPELFFNVLLPPIIFHAGYSMKRRHFFRNFGAIIAFAFAGTIISTFVIGGILFGITQLMDYLMLSFNDCLFYGAIISATDPVTVLAIFQDLNVDVDLFAFVFGESVLNDAVAIVLSGAIEKYKTVSSGGGFEGIAVLQSIANFLKIFFGAFGIGCAFGCANAVVTKYTHVRDYPLLETSLFFLMSYGTYMASEAAGFTGIVAVLFCGICQAHYTYNNLSTESKQRTKQLWELLNFLAENFVFAYIGVSTFTFQRHNWNPGFIFAAFFAMIVSRAFNIYPLSFLLNLGRSKKIPWSHQHMLMFSGLRGAIAFALSIRNTSTDQRRLMFSTTLLVVIGTVILCGGFTTQMLQLLKIQVGVEDEKESDFQAVRTVSAIRQRQYSTMENMAANPAATTPSVSPSRPAPDAGTLESAAPPKEEGKAWLILKWHNVDTRYVKPFLTHARPPLTETVSGCCLPLARVLTTDQQLMNVQPKREDSDDTDLIIDENELSYGEQNSATQADSGQTTPVSNSQFTIVGNTLTNRSGSDSRV